MANVVVIGGRNMKSTRKARTVSSRKRKVFPRVSAKRIVAVANRAVRKALREHKLAGNPVAVWRDGKVVVLQPEEIEV